MHLNSGFISLMLPAFQWDSSFCKPSTFFSLGKFSTVTTLMTEFLPLALIALSFICYVSSPEAFMCCLCCHHLHILILSLCILEQFSQMCVSHHWFPFLRCQFLSLLYPTHLELLIWPFLYHTNVSLPCLALFSSQPFALFPLCSFCFIVLMFGIIETMEQQF